MAEERLRCVWEVTAGVIPGTPEPEHTKRVFLTSAEWEGGSVVGSALFKEKQDEASRYVASLQSPQHLNWVRLDWVWF